VGAAHAGRRGARRALALVQINLGPYHTARCRALAEALAPEDMRLLVVELATVEEIRGWRIDRSALPWDHVTLAGGRYGEASKARLTWRLIQALERNDVGVVVVAGYREIPMLGAVAWAKTRRRRVGLMSVSTDVDKRRVMPLERAKQVLVRRFDFGLVAGQRAGDYLCRLGMPKGRITVGGNVVDSSFFARRSAEVMEREASWRARYGLPARYFLYVGRLAPEKNLKVLLHAYGRYAAQAPRDPWHLVCVGNGPEERALTDEAKGLAPGAVHFAGFKDVDELPVYYSLAGCFVLPSTSEPWGLVVNEAMACGLPVLVSDRCGCVPELIQEGRNGYRFAPDDVDHLALLLARVASAEGERQAMARVSRALISDYTPERWASRLVEAAAAGPARRHAGG
jgi:glycosyltransferase involved in cell wall biosynthesis